MAFFSQKLAILLSYSYAASPAPKSAIQNLRSLHVSGFLGSFSNRFSTVQEHSNPKILSQNPGKEVVKDQNLDFQIWHNGGGRFHKAALIDPTSVIETNALIHSEAIVGPDVHVGSGTIIGPAVTIGQSSRIGYNVVLTNCMVGDYCVIHNGACIGQDGFGFFVNEQGQMMKKPQNLKARIGNHVEIGANTCIDRGSWRDTTVGDHTKIDNLVQIGHNVLIGENCMLCGQVGIAGSVTIGDYVTLGGRVAIRDHVHIAAKVRIAANSCVTKTIDQPGDYGGFPAVPIREWRKQVATLRQTAAKYSVKGA